MTKFLTKFWNISLSLRPDTVGVLSSEKRGRVNGALVGMTSV